VIFNDEVVDYRFIPVYVSNLSTFATCADNAVWPPEHNADVCIPELATLNLAVFIDDVVDYVGLLYFSTFAILKLLPVYPVKLSALVVFPHPPLPATAAFNEVVVD